MTLSLLPISGEGRGPRASSNFFFGRVPMKRACEDEGRAMASVARAVRATRRRRSRGRCERNRRMILPRFRGHQTKHESAVGVFNHGTEAKEVHRRVQGGSGG